MPAGYGRSQEDKFSSFDAYIDEIFSDLSTDAPSSVPSATPSSVPSAMSTVRSPRREPSSLAFAPVDSYPRSRSQSNQPPDSVERRAQRSEPTGRSLVTASQVACAQLERPPSSTVSHAAVAFNFRKPESTPPSLPPGPWPQHSEAEDQASDQQATARGQTIQMPEGSLHDLHQQDQLHQLQQIQEQLRTGPLVQPPEGPSGPLHDLHQQDQLYQLQQIQQQLRMARPQLTEPTTLARPQLTEPTTQDLWQQPQMFQLPSTFAGAETRRGTLCADVVGVVAMPPSPAMPLSPQAHFPVEMAPSGHFMNMDDQEVSGVSSRRSSHTALRTPSPSPTRHSQVPQSRTDNYPSSSSPQRRRRGPDRFFYDKSTYTGVHRYGGPSHIDTGGRNLWADLSEMTRGGLRSGGGTFISSKGNALTKVAIPASLNMSFGGADSVHSYSQVTQARCDSRQRTPSRGPSPCASPTRSRSSSYDRRRDAEEPLGAAENADQFLQSDTGVDTERRLKNALLALRGGDQRGASGGGGPDRFFHDTSTYTGTHRHGGPRTNDTGGVSQFAHLSEMTRPGLRSGGTYVSSASPSRGRSPSPRHVESLVGGRTPSTSPSSRCASFRGGNRSNMDGRQVRGPERFYHDASTYTGVHKARHASACVFSHDKSLNAQERWLS